MLAADRGFVRLILDLEQLPNAAALLGWLRRTVPLPVPLEARPQASVYGGTPPQSVGAPALNLSGARVLWVDDVPTNNDRLAEQLRRSGAEVRQVKSTAEALTELAWQPHVVITDMKRGSEKRAGIDGITAVKARGFAGRVIVYAQTRDVQLLIDAENAGALVARSATMLVDLIEAAPR